VLVAYADRETYTTSHQFDMLAVLSTGVTSIDVRKVMPLLTAIHMADMRSHSVLHNVPLSTSVSIGLPKLFAAAFLCILIEHMTRLALGAMLDAQSMLCGFRGILKGCLDCDVVLDSSFRICENPSSLEQLLDCRGRLAGTSFPDLLSADDNSQARFDNFMTRPAGTTDEQSLPGCPPCVRVSLVKPGGGKKGVDIFRVLLPAMSDDREGRSLLAIKEDPEASTEREAEGPEINPFVMPTTLGTGPVSATSTSQASSKSETFLPVDGWPELQEMAYLLDAGTEWFDVVEVRLRFNRLGKDSQHGMPHLKNLVSPKDWKSLRPKLSQLVWNSFDQSQQAVPEDIGPVQVRVPGCNYNLLARTGQLTLVIPPSINPASNDCSARPIYFAFRATSFSHTGQKNRKKPTKPQDLTGIPEATRRRKHQSEADFERNHS